MNFSIYGEESIEGNPTMEVRPKTITDYLDIIKLRKYYVLIPFLCIFLISVIVSFVLTPIYKSSTTILIEGQQIPSDFVRSTVTEYVEQSIQTIKQRIMSRTRLMDIIDRFDLYQDLQKKETKEEIIDRMREDIKLNMISAEVVDQRTGRPTTATIAFSLSYEWKDPKKVLEVANRLASLYLDQNLKDREEKARTTSIFIEAEIKGLNENMDKLEAKIAQFKEKHFQALPEMSQLNLQMFQRLDRELENLEQQIRNVSERKVFLEGQLTGIDTDLPGIQGPAGQTADAKQRLKYLYVQDISLRSALSEKHPDVIKMGNEIASLEKEVALKDEIQLKRNQLEELKTDLAVRMGKLSGKHPDVIKLKKSIQILEEEIAEKVSQTGNRQNVPENPENPAYINISTQLDTAKMDIAFLKEERKRLKAKIADYQNRLELTPQIELEYKLLARDYDNARIRYQETLHKLMEAKSAESLEKGQKGQKFTVIDPAAFPEKPYKPNRLLIIMVGFVFGIGAGAGAAFLKEHSDQTIRSEYELTLLIRRPVLAMIPPIETTADLKLKKQRRIISTLSILAGIGLCVLSVHLFYKPVDMWWLLGMRKLVKLGLISP
jgi:uncharacterized protein involved in exopolysaccharide biosynthesis